MEHTDERVLRLLDDVVHHLLLADDFISTSRLSKAQTEIAAARAGLESLAETSLPRESHNCEFCKEK